jgi:photosystem II stability/assembly factor-like uncharacterized protein
MKPISTLFRRILYLGSPVQVLSLFATFLFIGQMLPHTARAQETTTLNWNYSSQGLPVSEVRPRTIVVTALAQQQNRFAPTVILYAATYGAGVYRSADSGKTWSAVNTALGNLFVNTLFVSGLQLFAGTESGLYASEDNGNTWRLFGSQATGLGSSSVKSMTGGMLDNIPYLFVGTNAGVFISRDGGFRWSNLNRGLSNTQFITALQLFGRRLFAGTPNAGLVAFNLDSLNARDTLANARWFPVNTSFNSASITSFLTTSTNRFYVGTGGAGVFFSDDVGVSWQSANFGLENPNVSALAISNTGFVTPNTRIFAATSTGLFATANSGGRWTGINTGFPIRSSGSILPFNNDVFVTAGPNVLRGTVFFAPPPIITLVTPSSIVARFGTTRDTIITIQGANFNDPIVSLNGVALNRLGWSSGSVRVTLPPALFADDGVKRFTLTNAEGQIATTLFTVSGQVAPFIQRISPDSLTVGDPDFDLQIIGRTLLDSATVTLANVPAPVTQRLGTTYISARVPAVAISVAGRKFVRVTNPNGQFFDYPFKVRAFPPRISEISPPTVSVGNADFQLTIRGAEFFTTANVEPLPLAPLTIQLGGVRLTLVRDNTSREVVVNVPRALVSSEATLTLRLTNDDGQFAETRLNVVPFGLSAIATPQTTICPNVRTPLTSTLTSGVPPFRIVWTNDKGGSVIESSIDANGVIRAFIAPTEPTRYTLTVTDRDGMGVTLTQSIQIGILQPQASTPPSVRFDTVNTFFRLSTTQTVRFTNTSPDGTTLTLTRGTSGSGNFRIVSGIGSSVLAGQSIDVGVVFEPSRDGETTDTLRFNFGPCDRSASTIVSGFRVTPVLPPPPLLAVATDPSGRVALGGAPTLAWLPVAFLSVPTGYTAQIARADNGFSFANGFTTPLFTSSVVMSATTLQPAFTLQPNTAYAWTVRAANSVTSSTWAIPYYFITPPSAAQRTTLAPTRLEFGNTIVNETERRGAQIATQSAQAINIVGADVFAPAGAPRAAFGLLEQVSPNFRTMPTTARIPANLIASFRPSDTAFHQGVLRLRTSVGDTLYALLNGNGVRCVPSAQPSNTEPCAETELAFQFKPFKDNKPRPDPGDIVTVQVLMRRSSGLDAARFVGRARQFTADIAIGNPDVLFPKDVTFPANLSAAQRTVTRTRVRLQNVPVPATGIVSGNNIVLAEFTGEALLADTLITSLRFTEFTWSDTPGGNSPGDANIRRIVRDSALTVETCEVNGVQRLFRLKPASLLTSLVVAPNPAHDKAEAFIRTEAATPLEISLVNAMGQVMRSESLEVFDAGDYAVTLKTKSLPQGAYMLIVRAKNEVQQRQIVIID